MTGQAIQRENNGDLAVIRIHLPAIDAVAAAAIEHACLDMSPLTALDFGEVRFITSAGVSALLKFVAHARAQGYSVVAINLRPHHQRVFKRAELLRFMPVVAESDLAPTGA